MTGFAVPFAFWLLAQTHFDDDFRLRPLHLVLLAGLLRLCFLARSAPRFPLEERAVWMVAPRLAGLGFVLHALIQVHVGARSDLVLPRLRLRYVVLTLTGTYILLELLAEASLREAATTGIGDRVHAVSILVLVLIITGLALRLRPDVLRPTRATVEVPASADPLLAEGLTRLVEEQQVFREEGLTIAHLAQRLGVQEYRVRQFINAQLGFRNFNAFLHQYRLREAQKALLDPARSRLGVAQIAFQVGYRSLGPSTRRSRKRRVSRRRSSGPPAGALRRPAHWSEAVPKGLSRLPDFGISQKRARRRETSRPSRPAFAVEVRESRRWTVSRRVIFGSFLALVVAAAMPAWAGGVYLKLSTEIAEAQAGRPFA